jgi:hypothetical protein
VSEPEVRALGRQLRRIGAAMHRVEGFDPTATAVHAWLYQLCVGWDCERDQCQAPDDPNHTCTGALNEIGAHHGWPDWFVTQLRDARRGARILVAEVDGVDARSGREHWTTG